jgi:porphobilinogen deaminase
VTAVDGSEQIDVSLAGGVDEAESLGVELARLALAEGARAIVAEARV